jgi:dTDP-4-amino-4,6-dideoxygalactose transaminase
VAGTYDEFLENLAVITPASSPESRHVYHLYVIRSSRRDELQAHLRQVGIGSAVHYPTPVHRQPVYADQGYRAGDFPVAERLANEVLSLPLYPFMPDEQLKYVASQMAAFQPELVVGDDRSVPSYEMSESG